MLALVMLTSRRSVMGAHVNRLPTTVLAGGCAALIAALNLFPLYRQLG